MENMSVELVVDNEVVNVPEEINIGKINFKQSRVLEFI